MQNQPSATLPANPFNPGSPVDPSDFVGRMQELEGFRQKLRQTQQGSIASMAVAGGYGIGKTSFLHKCKAIAEENNALVIYFSLNEMDEINRETLANMLIERLQDKVKEEAILQRISSQVMSTLKRIKITVGSSVGVGLEGDDKIYPNLQNALLNAWKALKGSKTAIVFLIDEARTLEKNRADLILYLRAVLEQLQVTKTPVMIVPAGKLTITGPSGSGFSPLVRTFPPSILENFNKDECISYVKRKLSSVGISINDSNFEKIYEVTEGHPFVVSSYLSAAYSKLQTGEKELRHEHLEAADIDFVKRNLSHFFARFYDQASKTSRLILEIIAKNKGVATLSYLSQQMKKENNELSPYLAKLVQDGAIVRIYRGEYRLFHKLLITYIVR